MDSNLSVNIITIDILNRDYKSPKDFCSLSFINFMLDKVGYCTILIVDKIYEA
jgi:hypothetical protein